MSASLEGLRKQAKKEFLGRGSVVGVGLTKEADDELVFLLEKESPGTQTDILNWASQHDVRVKFLFTGRVTAVRAKPKE